MEKMTEVFNTARILNTEKTYLLDNGRYRTVISFSLPLERVCFVPEEDGKYFLHINIFSKMCLRTYFYIEGIKLGASGVEIYINPENNYQLIIDYDEATSKVLSEVMQPIGGLV